MTVSAAIDYRNAGVDLAAADDAVARIGRHIERTRSAGTHAFDGGFASVTSLPIDGMIEPMLVTATDGAGTKLDLARSWNQLRGAGIDVVAMCVNDLITTGATPLSFLDYIATSRLDPAEVEELVAGIADGCEIAGCELVGGETAELPGMFQPGALDAAGFCTGIVDRHDMPGPHRVTDGDALIGIASSGFHANGYSLVRHALLDVAHRTPRDVVPGTDVPLVDVLLKPTRIYATAIRRLLDNLRVHSVANITGGGIPGNLPRALPDGLGATVDLDVLTVPPAMHEVARVLGRDIASMSDVFNMGIGMIVIVPAFEADGAVELLRSMGERADIIGRVMPTANRSERVTITGGTCT